MVINELMHEPVRRERERSRSRSSERSEIIAILEPYHDNYALAARVERDRPARGDARPVRGGDGGPSDRVVEYARRAERRAPRGAGRARRLVPHGRGGHARIGWDPGLRRGPRDRRRQPEDRGDRARRARAAQGDGRRSSTRRGRCASGPEHPRGAPGRGRCELDVDRGVARRDPAGDLEAAEAMLRRDDEALEAIDGAVLPRDHRRDPRERARGAGGSQDADEVRGRRRRASSDEDDQGRRSRGEPPAPRCSRIGRGREAVALAQQAVDRRGRERGHRDCKRRRPHGAWPRVSPSRARRNRAGPPCGRP